MQTQMGKKNKQLFATYFAMKLCWWNCMFDDYFVRLDLLKKTGDIEPKHGIRETALIS